MLAVVGASMGTQGIVRRWNYPNMLRSIVHEFGHALVGETLGFRINSMRFKYVLPDISLRPRPTLCDIGGTTELADIRDLDGKPRADKASELMGGGWDTRRGHRSLRIRG